MGNITHGGWIFNRRMYQSWQDMKQRCTNPNNHNYKHYGARGISFCDRWSNFDAFREDMGQMPDGMTLDRIDNDKGYSKDNCRWASVDDQRKNQRRYQKYTVNGETMIVSDWAKRLGMHHASLQSRLKYGWPVDLALTTPKGVRLPQALAAKEDK